MLAGSNFDFIIRYKRAQEEGTTHPDLRAWPPTLLLSPQVLLCGADGANTPGPAPWTPAAACTALHPGPPTTGDQTLTLCSPSGMGWQSKGWDRPITNALSLQWDQPYPFRAQTRGFVQPGNLDCELWQEPSLSTVVVISMKGLTGTGVSSRWYRSTRRAHRS